MPVIKNVSHKMKIEIVAILISSFAAAIAAIAAWKAVHATNRNTEAQIVIQLRNDFSSQILHNSFKRLRIFKDENEGVFSSEFIKLKKTNYDKYQELNDARRMVKGYYQKLYSLDINKLIRRDLLYSLIGNDQKKYILEILAPFERAMVEADQAINFDSSFFDWANRLQIRSNG